MYLLKRYTILVCYSLLLLSCGGGGNSSSSSNTLSANNLLNVEEVESNESTNINSQPITLSGRVVDGELMYATVFLDLNNNNLLDSDEPKAKTDEYGDFNLTIDSSVQEHINYKNSTARLISIGGFDKRFKREFMGLLMAPFNGEFSTNITPVTTLISTMFKGNKQQTLSEVKQHVAKSLNIDINDLMKDPVTLAKSGKLSLLQSSFKLHQSSELLSRNLHKNKETLQIYELIATQLNQEENLSLDNIFHHTVKEHSAQFKDVNLSLAALSQMMNNINNLFNDIKEVQYDSTLVTQISLTLDKTKEEIEDALNKKDQSLSDDNQWALSYEKHKTLDIKFEVVAKLLSGIGYENQELTKEIIKLNTVDDTLTLESLKELLEEDGKYEHIVKSIDEKLKDLHQDQGINPQNIAEVKVSTEESKSLDIKKIRESDWGEGFCERVEVKNNNSETIKWEIEITVGGIIDNLWNATYSQDKVTREVIASGLAWNNTLGNGQTTSFGYCAKKDAIVSMDKEAILKDKELLTFDSIRQDNESEDEIKSTLNLITSGVNGSAIGWQSNNVEVISNSGVVHRGESNTSVILTAHLTKGSETESKTFTLVVVANESQEGLSNVLDVDDNEEENISTPSADNSININDINKEAILKDKELLTFDSIRQDNEAENKIKSALNLITSGVNGSAIGWESNNVEVISNSGVAHRGESNISVILTAHLTKGSETESKTFTLVVLAKEGEENAVIVLDSNEEDNTSTPSADNSLNINDINKEAILKDKELLTFDSIRQDNEAENKIKTPLNLITSGVNGSAIGWQSNNIEVISNSGVVNRGESNTSVILTAHLTKGSETESKTFTLVVVGNESQEGLSNVLEADDEQDNDASNNSSNTTTTTTTNTTNTSHTNNTQANTSNIVSTTVTGRVIDGELIYATVFLDLNKNGLLDEGEPKAITDENGDYNLTFDSETKKYENYQNKTAPLISIGGFDKKSKKEFTGTFTAPFSEDNPNITPITTILTEMLKDDSTKSLDEHKALLANTLGVDAEDLTKDPVEMAQNGNPQLMKVALKVHQSSETLSKVLKSDGTDTNIYTLMAEQLSSGANLDKALEDTVDNNVDKFNADSMNIAKDAVEELNRNIEAVFENYKESFATDTTVITKVALNLEKTKEKVFDAVNKNETTAIVSIDWRDDMIEDNKIQIEIIRQLLTMVGYQNENDIEDIAKFNAIDDDLTLNGLRELLESDGNYPHIMAVIDEKLKDLSSDKGLNKTDAPKATISSLSIKKIRKSDWNNGFCEDIEVKNISSETIKWEVTTTVDGDINNLWSANYTQNPTTQEIIATGLAWNSTLNPNQTVTFGYCATKNATSHAQESSEDSSKLVVTKSPSNDWGSGFCENVRVTNNENIEIRAWSISTTVNGDIYQVWNATYEQEGSTLTVHGVDWNSNIKANSFVDFGYCANKVISPTNPDKIAVEKDKGALSFDTIKLENSSQESIESDLKLITTGSNGSTITWESNSSTISSTGVVSRPAIGEVNVGVELLAVLRKGAFRETKRFNLKVIANVIPEWDGNGIVYHEGNLVTYQGKIYKVILAHTSVVNWYPDTVWYFELQEDNETVSMTDKEAVDKEKEHLSFEIIKNLNSNQNQIMSNLNLSIEGLYDTNITWKSNNKDIIDSNGKVTQTENNETVILTATISKGSESVTKEFVLIVTALVNTGIPKWSGKGVAYSVGDLVSYNGKIYKVVLAHISVSDWYPNTVWYFELQEESDDVPAMTDQELVAKDKELLTFEIIRGANESKDTITSPLNLISSGVNGSSISWESNRSSRISNSGQVTRTENNESVTLIATITKGSESDTKEFVLTVSASVNIGIAEWDGNGVTYSLGNLVSYKGKIYKVIVAHTSLVNWYPDEVPYFEVYEEDSNDTGGEDNNQTSGGDDNATDGGIDDINSSQRLAVGYLPTWLLEGFHTVDYASSQIATIDNLYTHVVISFAKPDMTFNGTNFVGTGVEFASYLEGVKKAIEVLQQRGVKVLLAVGGATYNNWDPLANEQGVEISSTTHKKALKAFMDALNLDGIDVDYEVTGADSANVARYYKSILALKEVVGDKLLTMAGWSTGADCTADTSEHLDCQGKVSYWGNSAGRERLLFKKFRDDGYNVEELFDYVAIMTYDGGLSRFDPITLFKNYQAIYAGPLAMGFEIPAEAWGGAELVVTNAQAEACESTSMLSGDSYSTSAEKKHYSIERLVNFVNSVPNSGIMLWSLYEAKHGANCASAVDYNGFTAAMKNYLAEKSDSNETNSSSGDDSSQVGSKYHDVLGLSLKFYEAQRAVGPFPMVEWRKPASTNDGADVGLDLNGGWFDAGDHVKFNLPMSYSVGMLNWSLIDQEEAYRQAGKLTYGKEQVKYALDYLLETYQAGANLDSPDDDTIHFQVADGHTDHGFWGAPENLNMERPTFTCDANGGCAAVAGSMVGAFASGAILFKEDTAYATQLLESAKRLYKFAMKYQTDTDYSSVGQDFYALYQNGNNEDQLAWAGVWLYKATNDAQYLNDAKAIMEGIYPWSGHSWDNLGLGVFTLLAEETNDAGYRTLVENELNKWVNKDVPTSTGGLRVLQQWGSLRYASTASYIALVYSDQLSAGAKKDSYIAFAKSQIDYILGDNPNNFSYVVGYGDNYPLRPHHRAASGTTETDSAANKYVIEGALVGGPLSADDNSYQDIRHGEVGYTANEVATDYNAGFTGALAKLALLYGEETNTTDTEDDNANSDDNETTENPSDAELVATAKEALNFDTIKNTNTLATEIKTNLSLITLGQGDVSIRWSSSANAISPQGVVTRGSNNTQVTLTATLSHGDASGTKVFTLVVLKEEVTGGACQVTYGVRDTWDAGFVVDFSLVNQLNNVYGWEVTFTLPEGQRVDSLWNGRHTADTGFIKVTNEDYNAQVNKGAKLEFGFVINHGSGQAGEPTDIRFNGQLCDGQIGGVEKPAQPTNLDAELINNAKVTLTWDDNSANEENFLVYQSKDLGSWELLALLDANTSSYKNIEVEVEHSYQFKIEAKNIAGTSTSETVTVTPILITVQSGVSNKAISLVNNCMSCHTETNSHPSIPIIHGLSRDYLEKTLKGYRTSDANSEHFSFAMHRVMDGYTDEEMELMIDYFAAQPWVGNEVVSYDVESLSLGKTLFESNCVVCHGDDAKKDGIILSGQSEAYLVDTMTNYAKGLHKDAHDGMKFVFESNIGVDEAKIEALAKYLAVGMEVPDGTNDTIRGFKAKYLSSSNSIEVSWDYINPDALAVEVMVDDTIVKRLNAVTGSSVTLENNGTDSFVIGNHYEVQLKAIFSDTEVTSSTILVEIKTDLAYGEEHYKSNCKVCHGVNGTARADLTAWNPSEHSFTDFTRNSTMDPSYYSNCDDECLELIGTYVREVLEPRVRENNTSSVEDVYSDLPRGYRLLNNMEYTNTLYSLFEIESNAERSTTLALEYTDLPKDNIVEGYNTNRDMNRIDEDKLKALNVMAQRVEAYLESLKGKNSNACLINGYDFCIADVDNFLTNFAPKIFRRPLSLGEKNKYVALESVGKIVGDMLVSPKFLYRSEMGELTEENGVYALTQYEIATAIAYSMAGTTPDDELLSLAASGALSQPNTRVTQAVRLLNLQTGKDKLDDFIGRWLLEDNIFSLSDKNPERFAGYNEEVRTAQSQEVLKYFRMVMESNSKSSYKDLFINEDMMSNKVLSDFYGEGSSTSSSFEKVPSHTNRHGILTLGAISSKYANSEESHPFKRGTFVLKRLMCHDMGLPGNGGDIPAIVDHVGQNKRDRYAEHVNDPSCATCHNLIDPIGFTWENYDGSGRYRTAEYHSAENGGPKAIDASVTLRGLLTFDESETHPANGIYDVSQLIAESDRGPSCMALQYYRYISGDAEASLENSYVVKKIASDFKDEQYDLQSLFTNMVKLNSFVTRRGE